MAASYIYVPGLARKELLKDAKGKPIQRPVKEKLDEVFGADPFLTNAVDCLKTKKQATLLDCGKELRWVDTNKLPKLFKGKKGKKVSTKPLLGEVGDNILAKSMASSPKAPPPLAYIEAKDFGPLSCVTNVMLAQPVPVNIRGKQNLKVVTSKDTLFVVGHGNPRGGALSFKTPTQEKCGKENCDLEHKIIWSVDPSALAALLVDEGLSKKHKRIQLVMCFGAGLSQEEHQTVQPYAQRLAGALRSHGYKAVEVGGALGTVIGGSLMVRKKLTKEILLDDKFRLLIEQDLDEYEDSLQWFTGK